MSEEEVTTYSGLVRMLRERIAGYVREGVERARALREAVRLINESVEVEDRPGKAALEPPMEARAILPFADRDVGFISTITVSVVDDGRSYHRRFRSTLTSLSPRGKGSR
jgi:hypothetical protein